ncbi:hypothetical protein RJG79_08660 [Mycoplasmatota bacterium WC44]
MYSVEVETYDGLKAGIHILDNYDVWGVNVECFTVFKDMTNAGNLLESVKGSNQFKKAVLKEINIDLSML